MQNCFFDLDLRIDMSVKVIPNVPVAINVKDGFYNIYNSNAVVMVQLMQTNLLLCKRVENGELIFESCL